MSKSEQVVTTSHTTSSWRKRKSDGEVPAPPAQPDFSEADDAAEEMAAADVQPDVELRSESSDEHFTDQDYFLCQCCRCGIYGSGDALVQEDSFLHSWCAAPFVCSDSAACSARQAHGAAGDAAAVQQ